MEIVISDRAYSDLDYWKKTNNTPILKKIRALLDSILNTPYHGIGKPEPLKHDFSGYWSRRIDREHRLVYQVIENKIKIHSLRGHYVPQK